MGPTAGLAFKPVHLEEALLSSAVGLWFEIHAENYMVAGGPRLIMLNALRQAAPLSIHGVGLSLAGASAPDDRHLRALKGLCDRFDPFLVSEHLAWSRVEGSCFPDLLPFPRTHEALDLTARNVDIAQNFLRRPIAIENPSLYLALEGHDWGEADFLAELVKRTGCRLLLDIANVVVSANNLGFDPYAYVDALPSAAIAEFHLAGYRPDPVHGARLLIDSHDAPVSEQVWALYCHALRRFGAMPTLVERDGAIPTFDVLMAERDRAASLMRIGGKVIAHV